MRETNHRRLGFVAADPLSSQGQWEASPPGVGNALAALRLLPERKNHEIMILGVEPKIIDFGLELTPEIQRLLPRLVRTSKHILAQWYLIPPPHEKPADLVKMNFPEKTEVSL